LTDADLRILRLVRDSLALDPPMQRRARRDIINPAITPRSRMSNWEEVNRHASELVKLTVEAANNGAEPLPDEEVTRLGVVIATERQLLIDAMSGLLQLEDPEAARSPGVAEFDAGFLYGLAFAKACDDARIALHRMQRGRVLNLAKGNATRFTDHDDRRSE
jgi:hypothetical protein